MLNINLKSDFFHKRNVLFIQDFCPHCIKWEEFIERKNINLQPNHRVQIINCTKWVNTGIPDNPLIKIYSKYLDGFPCLFFDGKKISGTNSKEEAEAFFRSYFSNRFIIPENMESIKGKSITFDFDCHYKKTLFGRRIVCK